ncbi:glucose 1-dehydrogenase [Halomonas campisalis]|uniref:Glucose 1-dehydrogenase n=1 Tax=Billgrantia campisalis TaxID=74661 RepID=A0ABS9P6W3_9GAMM|nr:glucose 1-dehydrogenase [Halomonas campisalis]MCG6656977.1 glucose 1-dehydrogenase [Halomonas campisalis]MDR5862164.1 glucose 1-dehydrogenase [Halomonas campisalis]
MTASRFSLEGRIALVTGASSGLGRHFATVLAEAGARVVVGARRRERLEALVAEIQAAGGQALAVSLDVTDAASIIAAFDAAEQEFGIIDLLVNNAGLGDTEGFLKMSEASWDAMLDTNLKGVWRLTQEASRRLVATGKPGSIVNIASILGLRVAPKLSHYSAAKAGVIQLTRSLSLELARHDIRINAIAPGYFRTEMNEDFFSTVKAHAYIDQVVPMQRLGNLQDLDGALLLLASDAGAFMTGTVIAVDGGHSNSSL